MLILKEIKCKEADLFSSQIASYSTIEKNKLRIDNRQMLDNQSPIYVDGV